MPMMMAKVPQRIAEPLAGDTHNLNPIDQQTRKKLGVALHLQVCLYAQEVSTVLR